MLVFRRLSFFVSILVGILCLPAAGGAKRIAPPIVKPVVVNGIKYVAPNDQGTIGHVQAWNIKTGKKLWDKKLYQIKLDRKLETDVQWVFIQELTVNGDRLRIVNEKQQAFTVKLN
jgi:outer membrane protein assembly factor BamB